MRAFSPYLFRHGRPPGPYCLQKLLRSRFYGAAQEKPTTSQTASFQDETGSYNPKNVAHEPPVSAHGTHERAHEESSRGDDVYGPEEAVREYKTLSGEWEEKKKMQRALGMRWKCFACGLSFDAENYSDSAAEITNDDAQNLCITQGHWRRCNACRTAPPSEEDVVLQCRGLCEQRRSRVHFTEGASVCNAC